jgi:hypothetical protein
LENEIMKKIFALPLAAVVAAGFVACDTDSTLLAPEGPNRELVNEDLRIDAKDVNAWVYGSFSITFEGQPGVLGGGVEANFPGKGKSGSGTCGEENDEGVNDGVWYNPQGRRTSGSASAPHPHCVGSGGGSVSVVLEPISVYNGGTFGTASEYLQFARENPDGRVHITGSDGQPDKQGTQAQGVIRAYAILAETLGAENTRVGILTIDLEQYKSTGSSSVNYFTTGCNMGLPNTADLPCLDKVIRANYEPWGPNAEGRTITFIEGVTDLESYPVTGYLYWHRLGADRAPYNYTD